MGRWKHGRIRKIHLDKIILHIYALVHAYEKQQYKQMHIYHDEIHKQYAKNIKIRCSIIINTNQLPTVESIWDVFVCVSVTLVLSLIATRKVL